MQKCEEEQEDEGFGRERDGRRYLIECAVAGETVGWMDWERETVFGLSHMCYNFRISCRHVFGLLS